MRIDQAAILCDGVIYTLPRPARHADILMSRVESRANGPIIRSPIASGEQGFTTSEGGFVSREAAYIIARAAGQLIAREMGGPKLYSEDLW